MPKTHPHGPTAAGREKWTPQLGCWVGDSHPGYFMGTPRGRGGRLSCALVTQPAVTQRHHGAVSTTSAVPLLCAACESSCQLPNKRTAPVRVRFYHPGPDESWCGMAVLLCCQRSPEGLHCCYCSHTWEQHQNHHRKPKYLLKDMGHTDPEGHLWGPAEEEPSGSPGCLDLVWKDSPLRLIWRVYLSLGASHWKMQTLIPIPELPRELEDSFAVFTVCVASPLPVFLFLLSVTRSLTKPRGGERRGGTKPCL